MSQKLILITSILIISMALVMGFHAIEDLTRKKPVLHQYDYILEVDGTDSCLKYTIYDNHHKYVGQFTDTEGLNNIIEQDNL